MSENLVSVLNIGGTEYTIKDASARESLDSLGKTLTIQDTRVFDAPITYDGKSNVTLNMEQYYMLNNTKTANPYALTFTGNSSATYDGSGAVTVNIPTPKSYSLVGTYTSSTETLEITLA